MPPFFSLVESIERISHLWKNRAKLKAFQGTLPGVGVGRSLPSAGLGVGTSSQLGIGGFERDVDRGIGVGLHAKPLVNWGTVTSSFCPRG